eukprot:TRINITY_DN8522_c0_g1_i3.p2 TRINITY_DN8522_c0_g1~~TRINITY_DN8522_c0_g1_i3.p2  ORF type:complete len:126 (-),score=45.00 TRINITY_DN8522_c0_g1_i3:19-396(-)
MENIELFNQKLTDDINRLVLSEGVLLDPARFGQAIEAYNEAIRRANLEFTENKDLLLEIAQMMEKLIEVIKENAELITKAIAIAETKAQTKEKSLYEMTMSDLNELNKNLERVAIHGNINCLYLH